MCSHIVVPYQCADACFVNPYQEACSADIGILSKLTGLGVQDKDIETMVKHAQ